MDKKKGKLKYLIIGLSLVLVFAILFASELNPIRLLGSIYNVNEINSNIDKIKIGDRINYEINGYSDWQVVSIDKRNNTLDVVSRTNVEDITLTTKEDYENALDIFQTAANKYTDNKYAIKARSVSRSDLDNFAFDEVFWNADIYDGKVAFTNGSIEYKGTDDEENIYYLLPYVRYNFGSNYWEHSLGDEVTIITPWMNKWIVAEYPNNWNATPLIASEPIAIDISSQEFMKDPEAYFNGIYDEIKNSDPNIVDVGNFGINYGFNWLYQTEELKNHYQNIQANSNFINWNPSTNTYENYIEVGMDIYEIDYQNNDYHSSWKTYRKSLPYTKGFRPIVTLKYSDELLEANEIYNGLQIGDYVNYSANEYHNWRVLSFDKENGTVDIISGGVVKNLPLYGIDNYENYEDILQQEVDAYKVGDKVISARIVNYEDLSNLNKINDNVNVKYWTFEKKDYNKKAVDDTSSPYATNAYYDASIMYYDMNESMIQRKWVSLYISSGLNSGGNSTLSNYNGTGDLSYTAGIRPVITIKIDDIEKVSEEEKNNIINEEKNQQNNISNEQQNNSEKNVTNDSTRNVTNNYINVIDKKDNSNNKDNVNGSGNSIDSKNNDEVNNNYITSNSKGNQNKLVKYIIIALIVLNIAIIGQVILSVFIIKNMKKNKRVKK